MAKDPAILFYTGDFIVGTMTMTDDQVGKYIRLLCLQHNQEGKISEEDMLKICKTHDKDIFRKFTKHIDGYYYNQRMTEEANKRANFANSRRTNRLGKKTTNTSTSHENQVLNTSTSHENQVLEVVNHMENENTTTIIIDNKGINKVNSNNNINNSSRKDVLITSSTSDKDMIELKNGLKNINFSGNWALSAPVE